MNRILAFLGSILDPRAYLQCLRLVHYWNYAHARPRRRLRAGPGVAMSPTVSLRNGERIEIGARSHIGEYCSLWAGDNSGRIVIGDDALFGPRVYITASNYSYADARPIMLQQRVERDVHIGPGVWLGAGVVVLPGVTVGAGAIVAAGAVVNRDLPPGAIAAGVPARIVKQRVTRPVAVAGVNGSRASADHAP